MLLLKLQNVAGTGVLGIDMMEDKEHGLLVHEVTNTVEQRASSATDIDI